MAKNTYKQQPDAAPGRSNEPRAAAEPKTARNQPRAAAEPARESRRNEPRNAAPKAPRKPLKLPAVKLGGLFDVRRQLGRLPATEPTYAAFVAPALFRQIQTDIQRQTGQFPAAYRVACLGLPPAVASLNNFYTLDAYQNNYPLAYKHQFRQLTAGELAKDAALRTYFDAWGNRCYLFSAELGKNFRVGALQGAVVRHWDFNAAAFRHLGGQYVLSGARLARPEQCGLRLFGHYTSAGAYWQVWVYAVQ